MLVRDLQQEVVGNQRQERSQDRRSSSIYIIPSSFSRSNSSKSHTESLTDYSGYKSKGPLGKKNTICPLGPRRHHHAQSCSLLANRIKHTSRFHPFAAALFLRIPAATTRWFMRDAAPALSSNERKAPWGVLWSMTEASGIILDVCMCHRILIMGSGVSWKLQQWQHLQRR